MTAIHPGPTGTTLPKPSTLLWAATALALAASLGLLSFGPDLEYLLPIYGLAFVLALMAVRPAQELTPFDWLMLGWLLVVLLNPLTSVVPASSWWLSIVIALQPLSLLAGSANAMAKEQWQKIWLVVCGIAAFVCLWMAAEFVSSGGQRANGPISDFNAAGTLVYLVLLPLLGQYLTGDRPQRPAQLLRLALITLFAFALFATASRGAVGVFALTGTLLIAVIAIQGRGVEHRFVTIALAGAAIAGALVLNMAVSNPLVSDSLQTRNVTDLAHDQSTQHRLLMWRSTLEIYQTYPYLGSGLGTFVMVYPAVRSPIETDTAGYHAHNDYLEFLAEGGPLLLAGLMLFAAWVAHTLYRVIFDPRWREHPERWQALAIALALSAALVHATVNFIFYVPAAAVLIALWNIRLRSLMRNERAEPAQVEHKSTALGWVALTGFAGLVVLALNVYSANRFDPTKLQSNDYSVGSSRYRQALLIRSFMPFDYVSLMYLVRAQTQEAIKWKGDTVGDAWAKAALIDIEALRRSKRFDCIAESAHAWLAHLYGDRLSVPMAKVDPLVLLDRATENNPTCMKLYADAAQIALQTERYADGLAVAEKALRWTDVRVTGRNETLAAIEALAELYLRAGHPRFADFYARQVLANDGTRAKARRILEQARAGLVTEKAPMSLGTPTAG